MLMLLPLWISREAKLLRANSVKNSSKSTFQSSILTLWQARTKSSIAATISSPRSSPIWSTVIRDMASCTALIMIVEPNLASFLLMARSVRPVTLWCALPSNGSEADWPSTSTATVAMASTWQVCSSSMGRQALSSILSNLEPRRPRWKDQAPSCLSVALMVAIILPSRASKGTPLLTA